MERSSTGPQRVSLHEELTKRLPKLIDALNLDYSESFNYYRCRCPIHRSDNYNSLTIYKDSGIWTCWTSNCNELYGHQLTGLCEAVSKDANFVAKFIDGTAALTDKYEPPKREIVKYNIDREDIRGRLEIPSKFYLARGFSGEILDRFDVGDCYKKEMKGRTVFPFYDIDGSYIGCSGRSHIDKTYIPKWRHSKGLPSSLTFYGIDKSIESIKTSKIAIIVEGCGDVLKMHEYGIPAIGCNGAKLSRGQASLLKKIGVKKIVICLDPDPDRMVNGEMVEGTGPARTRQIMQRFGKMFEFVPIKLVHDPGDSSQEELISAIGNYI